LYVHNALHLVLFVMLLGCYGVVLSSTTVTWVITVARFTGYIAGIQCACPLCTTAVKWQPCCSLQVQYLSQLWWMVPIYCLASADFLL